MTTEQQYALPEGLPAPAPDVDGLGAEFWDATKEHRLLATMCTPEGEGAADARWDTWRITEFAEIPRASAMSATPSSS